jgi:hypothetical protein|nr:MAG TPA: portal protein [Caudoviricetes sp.]
MGIFNQFWKPKERKAIPMRENVNRVERDAEGNYWFLSDLFGHHTKWKAYYDMTDDKEKAEALSACTPFFTVVDKIGSMMSRGVPYVVDKNGNEKRSYADIRNILDTPNPLQTFSSFVKQIEICLKVFGYCPIVLVRTGKESVPKAMWIVPPELFHIVGTGKVFRQFELSEIVSEVYIDWGGKRLKLEDYEYLIIYDSNIRISDGISDILFDSVSDSLSQPISNWVASMSASHTLLVNGGPKGVLYNDYTDRMGNMALTSEDEKEIKDRFKRDYGLVNKEYPILVTRQKLGWLALDFDANQLKLHEEDKRCTDKIANAMGINANLFTDAKYDNLESAGKKAYQDVIIPDSIKIAGCLTRAICPEGVFIKIDFTDVECLQNNKETEANTLVKVADALQRLLEKSLITHDEARIEVARYIEIDPENPKGEFSSPSAVPDGENNS